MYQKIVRENIKRQNRKKIIDKLETYTVEQLDEFILLDYWNKSKKIDDELEEYLRIRKRKLNETFEWTPENMERFLSLNQKLIDCWKKLFAEAQTIFNVLQKRIDEKDDFLHDFEIEAKVDSDIYVPDEDGELDEPQDCIEEVLMDSLRTVSRIVNRKTFGSEQCFEWVIYLDKEQNWNHDFGGKFDNHFISQAIHELYDHSRLSFPDILKINRLWAELEVRHQHFQDL